MSMFIFKRDIPDCDKYYYRMFEDIYNCKSTFNLSTTLKLIKQYYINAIREFKQNE